MESVEQVLRDDMQLVSRARGRDVEAFQTLVLRYQDRVFNTAYRFTGDRGLAEDITQEAFFKAYKGLKKFKGKSSFSTWLYRITVNACTSEWRKSAARKRGNEIPFPGSGGGEPGRPFDPPAEESDPADAAERKEKSALVQEAIASLEDDFRIVVILRDIEGFSYEEIADILDRPVGTVRSRLHRARGDLKEKLKALF